MRWRKWNPDAPQPKRYRLCLVQLAPRVEGCVELPPAVVVGYIKWGSFKDPVSLRWRKRPYWVCPGVGGPRWEVTHYTEDLPEDMNAPGWPGFRKS